MNNIGSSCPWFFWVEWSWRAWRRTLRRWSGILLPAAWKLKEKSVTVYI
ncbi:MAG: hypothetical protein LBS77_01030 [Desulfovibrio sp.]|nr:hypothetical protein [Desulfovibrio sp.]